MTTKAGRKPANRWMDVQIVIATLAMTFSLFLWNIFASGQSTLATLSEAEPQVSLLTDDDEEQDRSSAANPNTVPTSAPANANPTPAQPQSFGTIFLGGSAPQTSSVSAGSASEAPMPVTTTGSSRP